MSAKLEFLEGDAFTFTWTIKRLGSVVDISSWTLELYLHDDGETAGTNRVNAAALTIVSGTAGTASYAFTATDTLITESTSSVTDVTGEYSIKTTDPSSNVQWTQKGRYTISRNPFIAAT